jgi:PEGA domain
MTEKSRAAPGLTSVIFMRIAEFSRLKVAEQAQLKAKLDALLVPIVDALPAEGCIMLDAPDGNAIVVLESPGAALQAAERALAASAGLPFCIGINHGPVQAAPGDPKAAALIGDGLLAAITAAEFSTPGRLLATRAFRDALEASAPQRAQGLVAAGVFTDSRVRSHEMFAFDAAAAHRRRRRLLAWGALGVCAILAAGYGARLLRFEALRAAKPAVILFEIRPHGEIFIDGVDKGRSPPLTQIEVKAGAHKIEVRNSAFTALDREVNLEPGETTTIAHRFAAAQKPTGFWQNLRRKLGSDK